MSKLAVIQSIGTAVPPFKILQQDYYSVLENANGMNRAEKLRLQKIYSKSGIESRHSVLEEFAKDNADNILFHPSNKTQLVSVSQRMDLFEEHAAALCKQAVLSCFEKTPSLKPAQITHLITFSCTGMYAPGLDIQLVELLQLDRNVERTCINFMGCYAGINALKIAHHIVRSSPEAIVLLVGVELCTLHYQNNDHQDQIIANALFADGAAACIVSSDALENDNSFSRLSLLNFYAEFEPAGKDEMVWRIGNFGFDLKLSMYVPALIKDNIAKLIQRLFDKAEVLREEVELFAIHPGGKKILEACESALAISREENKFSYDILRQYGNMSSVTLFFVLQKQMEALKSSDKGKKMLACAFGPGLTMESMIAEAG